MPKYRVGSMFDVFDEPRVQYVFVTTNAVLKNDGSLVMGMGAAGHAAKRWPELPAYFGSRIMSYAAQAGHVLDHNLRYRMALPMASQITDVERSYYLSKNTQWPYVGALQTKYHYRGSSMAELVEDSLEMLRIFAHCWTVPIHINYPGVGLGNLTVATVHPLLEKLLPDNVTVWSFKKH